MTDEEVLKKAIEKAHKNGMKFLIKEDTEEIWDMLYYDRYSIIFSHDFAKAFWPINKKKIEEYKKSLADWEKSTDESPDVRFDALLYYREALETEKNIWKHHLQQMVISENPITYLEKYL